MFVSVEILDSSKEKCKVQEKVILGDIYHDFVSGEAMNCLCMSLMIFIDSLFHITH